MKQIQCDHGKKLHYRLIHLMTQLAKMNRFVELLFFFSLAAGTSGVHRIRNGFLYYAHPGYMGVREAMDYCDSLGAQSPYDLTEDSMDFLAGIKRDLPTGSGVCLWMNITRAGGRYHWGTSGREVSPQMWAIGRPNDISGEFGVLFLAIGSSRGLQAVPADHRHHPLCMFDLTIREELEMLDNNWGLIDQSDRVRMQRIVNPFLPPHPNDLVGERIKSELTSEMNAALNVQASKIDQSMARVRETSSKVETMSKRLGSLEFKFNTLVTMLRKLVAPTFIDV